MSKSSIGTVGGLRVAILLAFCFVPAGLALAQHSGAGSSIGGFGASPTFAGGNVGFNNAGPVGAIPPSPGMGFGGTYVAPPIPYSDLAPLFGTPSTGYGYGIPNGGIGFYGNFNRRYGNYSAYAGYSNPFGYGNGYLPAGTIATGYPVGIDPSQEPSASFGSFGDDGSATRASRPQTRRARPSRGVSSRNRAEPTPLIPLDQLVAEDGAIRWPAETPKTPELETKLRVAEQAIDSVVRDFRGKGQAPSRKVALARGKLTDFAGPALKQIKAEGTSDGATFADFIKNLDQNLRALANVRSTATARRVGANLGVNPDGTPRLDEIPAPSARPDRPSPPRPAVGQP